MTGARLKVRLQFSERNRFREDVTPRMRTLSNVSLVAVATVEVDAIIKALEYSSRGIYFGRTILFSNSTSMLKQSAIEHVHIEKFMNVGEWGKFIVFELHKHITTSHIMLIHADGFVVNPEAWSDEFLQYDYIGAPWPLPRDSYSYRDYFGNIIRVGNSVSLRSQKLLKLPSDLGLTWSGEHGFLHEDGFLCVQNRHILQQHGIKYAPLSVACRFAHETPLRETQGIVPFAFHKWKGPNRKYPRFTVKQDRIVRAIKKVLRSWSLV